MSRGPRAGRDYTKVYLRNDTSEKISVAMRVIPFEVADGNSEVQEFVEGSPWRTLKWFNLSPGERSHVANTNNTFVYTYAKSPSGKEWVGSHRRNIGSPSRPEYVRFSERRVSIDVPEEWTFSFQSRDEDVEEEKTEIRYSIWNDTDDRVTFRLPSGRTYTLEPGDTKSRTSRAVGDKLKLHVENTDKNYALMNGKHKFFWSRSKNRIGFNSLEFTLLNFFKEIAMRSAMLCLSLAGMLTCTSFAQDKGATPSEVDGKWKLTGYVEDGNANPEEVKADFQVTRKDGVQEITKGGKSFTTRKYEFDANKSPKTIDFVNDAGSRTLAIYELKEDQMRVAILLDPAKQKLERPTDFDEKGKIIATYERLASADHAPQSPGSQLDSAFRFIKTKLIGKTIETKIVAKIAGGDLESEFTRRTLFLNLIQTPEGLTYDEVVLIKQCNYDLDKNGKRLDQPPAIKDRAVVQRVAVRERKSTGDLVGMSSILTNSLQDATGAVTAVRMRVTGERLELIRSTPVYEDFFAPGGKEIAGASETTTEYFMDNGRLKARTRDLGFDVDPKTLVRKPGRHDLTVEDVQVDGLF